MAKLQGCRIVVFLLFAATAIASNAQTFNTIASFDFTNGQNPSGLRQATDGNFYGVTEGGGANNGDLCGGFGCGTVFEVTTAGTLTTLHSFCSQTNCTDGSQPWAVPVQGTDGNFYGVTGVRGKIPGGTVFKITSTGNLTTLYTFCSQNNCADGSGPNALVQAANRTLYGTTFEGGTGKNSVAGTVFEITTSGKFTTLVNFIPWYQGVSPNSLIQATDGNFYGTTTGPTSGPGGNVFRVTPAGHFKKLYVFCKEGRSCTDGHFPNGLTQATDGNFYGTTYEGGAYGNGTFFQMTPAGSLTTLYSFCSQTNCADGADPEAKVVQATDGNFYGTTREGGAYDNGTIFQMTPAGSLTTLYSFCSQSNCADGASPFGLVQGTDGNFYGTTGAGGDMSDCAYDGCGTVYKLSMGFGPFVTFVLNSGKVGAKVEILGQGFTGTTGVSFNGTAASYVVHSDTYLTATVPQGATTGFATVTTPGGTLQSNVVFRVKP